MDRSQGFEHASLVGPVLIELPKERFFAKESFSQVELFAPVVHLTSFQNLEEAVSLFNATPYALTGGVFSQSSSEIDYLLKHLKAGNLYINRSCTGARVGIEPFGGFYQSGTGPKAGGVDYLASFVISKNVGASSLNQTEDKILIQNSIVCEWFSHGVQKMDLFFERLKSLTFITHNVCEWLDKKIKNPLPCLVRNNVLIPGQKNWSSFELWRDQWVYVVQSSIWHLEDWKMFVAMLETGRNFQLILVGDDNITQLKQILRILSELNAGSIVNETTLLDDEHLFQGSIKGADFFWIKGSLTWQKSFTGKLLKFGQKVDAKECKSIPKIMSADSMSGITTIADDCDSFRLLAYERAVAMNTMRHGAPLE